MSPFAHSILLNGGGNPRVNYYSHVLYLRLMRTILQERGVPDKGISIFSSDGNAPGKDQAILHPNKDSIRWLFRHRRERRFFPRNPELINTVIRRKSLIPAKRFQLKRHVSKLAGKVNKNEKPLFLFVTDHGTRNRRYRSGRNQNISMWRESLNVTQLHHILRPLNKKRVISVMSQCFSGSFAWSIFRKPGRLGIPNGNRCGFYATIPSRYAYGCFPETQLKKQVGHAYRFILAMRTASTFNEAHKRVLLTDITPDIPHRSSDSYLHALLTSDAKADGVRPYRLVDKILKKYGHLGYKGLKQDRKLMGQIAKRFGLTTPMNMAALYTQSRQLYKQMRWWSRAERMWRGAFTSARNHHLTKWYRSQPGFGKQVTRYLRLRRSVLKRLLRKIKDQDAKKRRNLLGSRLSPKGRKQARRHGGFRELMGQDKELLKRIKKTKWALKSRRKGRLLRLPVLNNPKGKRPANNGRQLRLGNIRFGKKRGRNARRRNVRIVRPGKLKLLKRKNRKINKYWTLRKTITHLRQGFYNYIHARPQLQIRLYQLMLKEKKMHEYAFFLKTKRAALKRMELLLYRIAGRLLLTHDNHPELRAHREGLKSLIACENTPLGQPTGVEPKALPTLRINTKTAPLPSWFGISFRPLKKGERTELPRGAVHVEQVYLRTPAANAGIRIGDIIVTMGDKQLREPYEIRERVMLSPAGRPTPVKLIRNGKLITRQVHFKRLTEPPAMKLPPLLGRYVNSLKALSLLKNSPALPSLRNKTVALYFWATWCGPCKAALPILRKWKKKYHAKGLRIVTVSNERSRIINNWLAKNGKRMPFTNARDARRTYFRMLRITATPTLVLLKNGRISLYKVGMGRLRKVERKIESLLQ